MRQCISCRNQLLRDGFIRLTKCSEEVILNPNRFQLGRSVYLCKSAACINLAIKEKKIPKMLRVSLSSIERIIPKLEELSISPSPRLPVSPTPSSRKVVLVK